MKRIPAVLLLLILAVFLPASSLPFVESGVLIPVGDEIYSSFDALFVISGKAVPSTSRPWTVAEARSYLELIEPSALEGEALSLYTGLHDHLFPDDGDMLSLTLTLAPEVYAHTNSSYSREEYWNYGYSRRSHFATASLDNSTHGISGHLELSWGRGIVSGDDASSSVTLREYVESMGKTWDGIGTLVDASEGEKYKVITTEKNYAGLFVINVPTGSNTDMNMPRRFWLDWSTSFMSIGMYKARKTWGYNRSGNFIFDSHNDYYNTLTLKTYSRSFNFEYTFMFPESYRGGTNYYVDDGGEMRRIFAAHRIEIRLLDSLNVVLSENTMYSFRSRADISLLNPAAFYHNNVNNRQFNSLAHVEFEWSVVPKLLLYGSWVIDQGSVPFLEDRSEEDQAMGYSIGLEYDSVLFGGIGRFSLESIYTNPALYRPTGSSDFILNYNAINADDYYRYPFYTYIGYRYGGDTVSLRLDGDWRRDCVHLYFSFALRFDGEFTLYDQYYSPLLLSSPSGDYETVIEFNIGGEYRLFLSSVCPLSAFFDVTLVSSSRSGFDAQVALGGKISYSVKTE